MVRYRRNKIKVSIIGGGITGVTTGIFLSRIAYPEGSPMYDVTIHESRSGIMQGASQTLARLHMGGEYPLDEITAQNCVTGAFLFSQVFPLNVFSDVHGIDYVLTKNSDAAGKLSADRLLQQYQRNADRYGLYFDRAIKQGYQSPLGSPGMLFRKLSQYELPTAFSAGIRTKEWGINSEMLNSYLRKKVRNTENLHIVNHQKIETVEKSNSGYLLRTGNGQAYDAEIVLNAAWENGYFLDSLLKKPEKNLKVYLRAMGIADISQCTEPTNPTFALIGADGGMYSPVTKNKAIVYVPADDISHIDTVELTVNNPQVPEAWYLPISDEAERKEKMHAHFTGMFPRLQAMKIEKLNIRPTISFDDTLERRRHIQPELIAENWYSIRSTKATFAVWSALEVLKLICPGALKGFDLEVNPVIPSTFFV